MELPIYTLHTWYSQKPLPTVFSRFTVNVNFANGVQGTGVVYLHTSLYFCAVVYYLVTKKSVT